MSLSTGSEISRRGFLASVLMAGASSELFASTGEPAPDRFGGFTVGVQSYSFREFDTEQALKQTQALGLRHIEFYQKHAPLESTAEQIRALKKLCGEYGVTPVAFGVQRFTSNHQDNRKVFEFGKALGVQCFSADPDPDSFDSLDKLCEEFQISIGIHPHGPIGGGRLHRWYSAETILAAVKDRHPLIGACLDTGHLIRAGRLGKELNPATEIRIMGKRNFGLHLKDNDNQTDKNVVLGKGRLNVLEVLKALQAVHFKGFLSLEYEENASNPKPDMAACLEVLENAANRLK